MQCMAVKAALPEELSETVKNPTQDSSIIVSGKVRADERAPGGFGMGIERCVAWICGLEHIRETIAFPRMLYRLHP